MSLEYKIETDLFEGPLDLLLHLINKLEIDIYELPVSEVTRQYMTFIHTMQELELNIASEYLVMAATLLQIKSSMLLPNPEIEEYAYDDGEDPKEALIERLIEYRKYKEVAENLHDRQVEANETYTRPPLKLAVAHKKVDMNNKGSIYDMLKAMQKVFDRKKWTQPMTRTIEKMDVSIKERMDQVLHALDKAPDGVDFESLFPYPSKGHMVVTFMAMLELMKEKQIYCVQKETFDRLILYRWREVDE